MVVNDLSSGVDGAEVNRSETAPARYPVNLRFTIPFYPSPIFVTLIAGKEKRGPARLAKERVLHPLDTWGNIVCAFCLGGMASIFIMFLTMALTGFPA